jgi:hypothetical protein
MINVMAQKYIRYSLLALFILPVGTLFTKPNLSFQIGVLIFFVVIPLIGLLSRKYWLFYYIYVAVPITLLIVSFAIWFASFFGDQAYSLLNIAGALWPLLLYFIIITILTITLHVCQKLDGKLQNQKTSPPSLEGGGSF